MNLTIRSGGEPGLKLSLFDFCDDGLLLKPRGYLLLQRLFRSAPN